MDAHAEAALAIDEARYVVGCQRASRPSLLIVRTERVFTAHIGTLSHTTDMNEYRRILGVPSI
jgi:hypothetical protein